MIDKGSIALAVVSMVAASIGAGAKVIAQAAPVADSTALTPLANITATGAMIWLVLRVMPKWQSDAKEERAAAEASKQKILEMHAAEREKMLAAYREELKEQRNTFECRGDH